MTDGLSAGDAVIVKGNTDLVNGEKVTVTKVINQTEQTSEQEQNTEEIEVTGIEYWQIFS